MASIRPLITCRSSNFIQICGAFIIVSIVLHGAVLKLDKSTLGSSSRKRRRTTNRQRVMLLSGSPQSGLSKLNNDISQWSKGYKLGTWSWSIPDIAKYNYTRDQGFDPLVDSMIYGLSHKLEMGPRFNDPHREAADYFLKEYRAAFVAEWMKKKNILVGSEKFLTIADGRGSDRIIESFIDILPWNHPQFSLSGSNRDVTALICHRPSRLKHLVSLWHLNKVRQGDIVLDNNKGERESMSFSKWLLSTDRIGDIDTLGIAEEFLHKDISVIIVDVENVLNNHLDLGHFISCNILDVPCSNNLVIGLESFQSTVPDLDLSGGSNHVDLSDATLREIEGALLKYDCKYQYYRNHERVELLNESLFNLFSLCASHIDDVPISREDLRHKIRQIVHNH